ncbi:MAG: DUF3105 domain-containing protein [Solirubrobacteraceae bacterium]
MRLLERLAIVLAAFAISVAVIAVLSGGLLAGRDNPGISGPGRQLGAQFRDLGHAHLAPGASHPHYDSEPPTSGAHVPLAIERDGSKINDDQLLQALEAGDVVIMYGSSRPPAGLGALADTIAAPFTPALAAAGQAVILARRPGTNGFLGLAWTHLVHVRSVDDPQLRSFILYWIGRGAPRS